MSSVSMSEAPMSLPAALRPLEDPCLNLPVSVTIPAYSISAHSDLNVLELDSRMSSTISHVDEAALSGAMAWSGHWSEEFAW